MGKALDRVTAWALVEAGYMPLPEYIAMFGEETAAEAYHYSRNTAPDLHCEHHHRPPGGQAGDVVGLVHHLAASGPQPISSRRLQTIPA